MPPKYKTCRRYNVPGHAHCLTFSCFHREAYLRDDRFCQLLVRALDSARRRQAFDLWAYVIMPEHVHLLLHPRGESYSISSILAAIKRPVAYQANRLLCAETAGPFWQAGGGFDRNLSAPLAIRAEIEYLHNNPVRKGLCARPEEWLFSSARFWSGETDVPLVMDRTLPPL